MLPIKPANRGGNDEQNPLQVDNREGTWFDLIEGIDYKYVVRISIQAGDK
jgi:hypothetical protein